MGGGKQVGSCLRGSCQPMLIRLALGIFVAQRRCPVLLWADPKVDLFWDPSRLEHVKPPSSYLMLEDQPKIDGESGYTIKGGAVSPF